MAVTGFETQHGSRGRVRQRMRILQPNPEEFISSRGCPSFGLLGSDKGCGVLVQALWASLRQQSEEMQKYPQLTCRRLQPIYAHLHPSAATPTAHPSQERLWAQSSQKVGTVETTE